MADQTTQKDENIEIQTMKGDLEKLSAAPIKETIKKPEMPVAPVFPISQEAQAPMSPMPPAAVMPPKPKVEMKTPFLAIPPKNIPPKKIAEVPSKPIFKATPVWLKISGIGFIILLIILAGLYGYWKIFVQGQLPAVTPKTSTTTPSGFPSPSTATTTAPIQFFNKLPNKEITIDISSKTSDSLIKALKSEAAVKESLSSVKKINITYQGKGITTEEFFNMMSIFAPKDFLSNYEDKFAFAFFSQKEGVRPILILKAKDKNLAETQMKNWESMTLPSDIMPLFLSDFKLPDPLPTFKSYLFIGQPVRYLNINVPFASLDYAIYNNFLILTTSSAGMFVILQDMTGQTVSSDYIKSLEASINSFVK